jgi:predicted DNA-binding protein (MmcQ/YjbR family)
MDLEALRAHCLDKPGVAEGYPFGTGALVMKVGPKVFAIIGEHDEPLTVSLKSEPEIAQVLRDTHDAVRPGYHLNKRHWITVTLDGSMHDERILEWVDDSYDLVLDSLPRRMRAGIEGRVS